MIVASINHKGGSGKTIVAQNLAVCYAHSGYKVCIVDANTRQESSVRWFGERTEANVEPRIPVLANANARSLRTTVEDLYNNEKYDIVIIDSPPSLERIAEEILLISHIAVIPVIPKGGNDIWSTEQLAELINQMSEEKKKRIPSFFVVNEYKSTVNLHKDFVNALEEHSKVYKIPILKTVLHDRVVYGNANSFGKGVFEMNNKLAIKEVISLANEVQEEFNKL